MIELLKEQYESKADNFILPLTGLEKSDMYDMRSHLFWNEYSIEDYKFMISFCSDKYDFLVAYLKAKVFPVLDRKGYLIESHEIGDRTVLVLDLSEWAMDIQQFLTGKYSKMSKEAKTLIEKYHTYNINQISIYIYATLYPGLQMAKLENMTPIEYVSHYYDLELEELKKTGEIGSMYDKMSETLITDISMFCQSDSKPAEA